MFISFYRFENEKQRKEVIENFLKNREIIKSRQLEKKRGKQVVIVCSARTRLLISRQKTIWNTRISQLEE